jgi:hypothetical protein
MINLEFKLDPKYLAYHTLVNCAPDRFQSGEPDKDVVAFQNLAWDKDKHAYNFLRRGIYEEVLLDCPSLKTLGASADKLLADMIGDRSFFRLQEQTLGSLSRIRQEWESDLPKSYEIMKELTGLGLDHKYEVFISHPSLKNGCGNDFRIFWSYRQDFPHYNTVYLWHEALHSLLPTRTSEANENVEHAAIELLTDDELRTRLNGGTYPPFTGHEDLAHLKNRLLPSWKNYLNMSGKNINEFLTTAQTLVEQNRRFPPRS